MEKIYFYKTSKKKVKASIIIPIPASKQVLRKNYLRVDNTPRGVNTFLAFAKRTFRDATHVNFYTVDTSEFLEQILLE